MCTNIAVLFMALAICHSFPQHSYGGGLGGGYGGGHGISHSIQISHTPATAVIPIVQKVAVAPVVHKAATVEVDHYAPPHYQFEYGVEDKHTGDIKSQHEEREGDNTRGYYSLHEPDGTVRTVHYTADKHNGFNAVVERSGHAVHLQVVHKAVVPIVQKAIVPSYGHY